METSTIFGELFRKWLALKENSSNNSFGQLGDVVWESSSSTSFGTLGVVVVVVLGH